MKKKILIALAILVVLGGIGGGIGLYFFNKPVKNFADSKAEFTLDAKDIFNEFIKDENAANLKYVSKDKTIQVSGKITELKNNDDGSVDITLDVNSTDGSLTGTVNKEDAVKTAKYKAGDNIIIKGQCTGLQELIGKDLIMIRCGIVEKQ